MLGPGLEDLVGAAVEATGTIYDTQPAEGASKVLSVADVHQITLNEMPGATTPAVTAGQPTPSGDTAPATEAGAEVPAAPSDTPAPATTPEATSPEAPDAATPAQPPLVVHSDTAKIIVIVALAAGGAVGVALGLAGGKSSTVSPE